MIPLLEYVEAANTSMTSIIIIYYTINFFILASNPSKVGTSQLQLPVLDNPPNHLLVEPRYYHGDGSKITLLPWPW